MSLLDFFRRLFLKRAPHVVKPGNNVTEDDLAGLQFDATLIAAISKEAGVEPQLLRNEEQGEVIGLRWLTSEAHSQTAQQAIRQIAKQNGYTLFVSEQGMGIQRESLALVKESDPYQVMRLMGTNGINYDIDTESLIQKMKLYDEQYSLQYIWIGFDGLSAIIHNPPADYTALADELYAWCPDIVDQGTGDVESLAKEMAETNLFYLWWD